MLVKYVASRSLNTLRPPCEWCQVKDKRNFFALSHFRLFGCVYMFFNYLMKDYEQILNIAVMQ